MKEKVTPAMAPLFQQHDASEFADFGCKTCHGPGAEKGEFEIEGFVSGLQYASPRQRSGRQPRGRSFLERLLR